MYCTGVHNTANSTTTIGDRTGLPVALWLVETTFFQYHNLCMAVRYSSALGSPLLISSRAWAFMDPGALYCSTEEQLLIGRASFVEFRG